MSVKAITWAFDQTTEQPVDKLVLLALADWADEDATCFPSRKRLAERAMCSVDTVDRSLKRLTESGRVEKVVREHESGGSSANQYVLPLVRGEAKATPDVAPPSRNLRPTPSRKTVREGEPQDCAGRGAAQGAATGTTTLTATRTITPLPPNVKPIASWRDAFGGDDHGVEFVDGKLTLVNGTRVEWVKNFGGDETALDLALVEIRCGLQPNSSTPLRLQVERALARIARERRDRSQNYDRAAKANGRMGTKQATPDAMRQIAAIVGKSVEELGA